MNPFRPLVKSPGFSAVAILTLALGLGASTALFSVAHALLVAPLPYGRGGQLVEVQSGHPVSPVTDLAPATFGDLDTHPTSFAALAAQYYYYVNLTGAGTPALLNSADVTPDYFRLFAVAALRGRLPQAADFQPGATPVVVLGHALWRRQFHARDSIVGEQISLDDTAYTVIGVMPASFKAPSEVAQLWRPMRPGADNLLERSSRYWTVFGRLKPDVTLTAANTELAAFARQAAQTHPKENDGWTLRAVDLRRLMVGDFRSGLLVLLGAVGCVMLVTCANLAGLTLVRASARRKELAIRTALGCSRFRLVRQLLAESLLLAALGGAVGVLFASWGIDALLASLPAGWLPRADEVALNWPVLAAASALTACTGLVAGLAPGFTASRIDPNDALKDHAYGSAGPAAGRLRSGLIIAELALALVLLADAGLLGRSFVGLLHKSPGLDAGRVLSLTISLSAPRYDSPARSWDFFSRAQAEVAAVPGVEAADFTQTSPFRWGIEAPFAPLPSGPTVAVADLPQAFVDSVGVDYFKALGIPLQAGRRFTPADDYKTPAIVILSETAARRYFSAENPLGRFLVAGTDPHARCEVVGVVGAVRRSGLAAATPLQVYRPLAQRTPPFATLMVRTALPPATLAKAVQAAHWRIDPSQPISDIATMETYVDRSVAQPRLHLTLFGLFAAVALLLAGLGLYGLVAYSVSQRTREFGIRAALGASPRKVLTLVLRDAAVPIAAGLALGLAGAFATTRLLHAMIFETSPHDPAVFLAAPLLLAAVALLACWLPARRAAQIDPITALRAE